MEESTIKNLSPAEAEKYGQQATDRELFEAIMQGYSSQIRGFAKWLFISNTDRESFANGSYVRNPMQFCTVYMAKEQLAIAESQKQLAEQQTKIAERQEEIAKRIEQGSDRTIKLTRRITCLTYVLVAVGIITFVAVCVQITIEKHWL